MKHIQNQTKEFQNNLSEQNIKGAVKSILACTWSSNGANSKLQTYDANSRILKEQTFSGVNCNELLYEGNYSYGNGERSVSKKEFSHNNNFSKRNFYEILFHYNSEGLPSEYKCFEVKISKSVGWGGGFMGDDMRNEYVRNHYLCEYDELKRLTKKRFKDTYENYDWINYKYNAQNLLSSITYYLGDRVTTTKQYMYDHSQNIVKEVLSNKNGSFETQYKFNVFGDLIEKRSSSIIHIYEYNYDSIGNPVSFYTKSNGIWSSTEYTISYY